MAELAERVPKEVRFNWPSGERLSLETSVALHAYRIAEEAVGNAIRHSDADRISLELETTSATQGVLSIRDNGKGFAQPAGRDGMGLQNMKYRAGVIGGRLKISTAPGEGTWISCTLQLEKRPARGPRTR